MTIQSLLEACPVVADGVFIRKLRPVADMQRDERGHWQQVQTFKPVGVALAKATFDSEENARIVAQACNFYAEHLKKDREAALLAEGDAA